MISTGNMPTVLLSTTDVDIVWSKVGSIKRWRCNRRSITVVTMFKQIMRALYDVKDIVKPAYSTVPKIIIAMEAAWAGVTTSGVFIMDFSHIKVTSGRELRSTSTVEMVLSRVAIIDVTSIPEKKKHTGKNRKKLDQHLIRISENFVANMMISAMII